MTRFKRIYKTETVLRKVSVLFGVWLKRDLESGMTAWRLPCRFLLSHPICIWKFHIAKCVILLLRYGSHKISSISFSFLEWKSAVHHLGEIRMKAIRLVCFCKTWDLVFRCWFVTILMIFGYYFTGGKQALFFIIYYTTDWGICKGQAIIRCELHFFGERRCWNIDWRL